MFFHFGPSVFGLYDKGETPKMFPEVWTSSDSHIDVIRVVGVVHSLIKVDVSIISSKVLGFLGPG